MGTFSPPLTFIQCTVSNRYHLISMAPSDFRGCGCLSGRSFTQKFYPQKHHFLSATDFHYRDALGGVTSKRTSSMF